jgi:predicted RNase H-like HicB family nuclease
MGDPMADVGFL